MTKTTVQQQDQQYVILDTKFGTFWQGPYPSAAAARADRKLMYGNNTRRYRIEQYDPARHTRRER